MASRETDTLRRLITDTLRHRNLALMQARDGGDIARLDQLLVNLEVALARFESLDDLRRALRRDR